MGQIVEDMVEQEMLGWFEELGYEVVYGPDIAFDGATPERKDYKQVVLVERLRETLHRINPDLPQQAINDAVDQITNPSMPGLITGNRKSHGWLTGGVQCIWQGDGETRGGMVKLVDFVDPNKNDWLVADQFSVQGPHQTRRPDAVIFLNGLPVAVIELKNPADENADVWAAFNQLP